MINCKFILTTYNLKMDYNVPDQSNTRYGHDPSNEEDKLNEREGDDLEEDDEYGDEIIDLGDDI